MSIGLRPSRDVSVQGDDTTALGSEPWMVADGLAIATFAGAFIEIVYSASLWDIPARPVFRFIQGDGGFVDRIAAGPVAGRGIWTGRVPSGTRQFAVSPTNRPGRFDFRIDGIRRRSLPALLIDGLRWNRRSARSALLTRLIGWRPESDVNLMWAIGSRPLSTYEAWSKRRARPLDMAGIDCPRVAWATAGSIRLFVASGGSPEALQRTLGSLDAQLYPHWTACVLEATNAVDPRVSCAGMEAALATIGDDPTAILRAGDILHPEALAMIVEAMARHPGARLFYGDETRRGADGLELVARPGWSPRLEAARSSLGVSFLRGLSAWTDADRRFLLNTGELPPAFIGGLDHDDVLPLRRVLVERRVAPPRSISPPVMPTVGAPAMASIIIPTRDHPPLLRRIIESIRAKSTAGRYEILVVDNGSVEPDAVALLHALRGDADVRVVEHPGPFNFSLMCNEAAGASSGTVLVFLNDDMKVLSDGWLDRLVSHALEPNTGAVGAKLTYPDGRIQHVGVLVGMGESAGHFGSLVPGDDPGWAGRNRAVHEVSAVTGACFAVSREKFDAVGGFDAASLPIELSDIDLCLKLNARGWQTIVDPFVHLMHEESVSRGGATLRRLDVYGGERAIFIERWRHVLRDDPTFHPGLSLYRWQAALG